MGADEHFSVADELIGKLTGLRDKAAEEVKRQNVRLAELRQSRIAPNVEATFIEKAAHVAEVNFLAALPGLVDDVVSTLEAVKPLYLRRVGETEAEEAPKGLLGRVFAKKQLRDKSVATASDQMEAQSAFTGRDVRIRQTFSIVEEAEASIPVRRAALDEAVFALQEIAVQLAGRVAKGEAGVRRELFATEELASELAAQSEVLALHARLLKGIDRTPCGVEDDLAAAAEAHMDALLDDL